MYTVEAMKSAHDAQLAKLGTLANKPLRQHIAELLQQAILAGDLPPGRALVESDLAAQFGVSRAPVREAIQLLANRGLIDIVAYKGTYVRALSEKDIRETYSLRSVLESFAAERLVALGTERDTKVLRAICEDMLRAAERKNYQELLSEDEAFHRTLVKLAQHELLYNAWNDLSVRVRQIMALSNVQFLDTMEVFYNHLPIVEALAAKDEAKAVRLVREHILSSADLVVRARKPATTESAVTEPPVTEPKL